MECPFEKIENEEELNAFLEWYLSDIKRTARAKNILFYMKKNEIEVYKEFTSQGLSSILKKNDDIELFTQNNTFSRYCLKENLSIYT